MDISLSLDTKALMDRAYEMRKSNFGDSIEFDIPDMTKVISVTGDKCILDCAHCGGHYLKGMTPISSDINFDDCSSVLISGGCDEMGKVDMGRHIAFIKNTKNKNVKVNTHLGLVEKEQIEKVSALTDCVSFDFVTDKNTIMDVYGLDKSADDYVRTYTELKKYTRVIPHICIGLHGGEVHGEYGALEKLKELGADALVFIVFIPTPGTRYAKKSPPAIDEIAKLLSTARIEFPNIPIHLGCMRPKGKLRAQIDFTAIKCGVNKIVNPTGPSIKLAKELGLEIKYGRECCVL